MGGGGGSKQQQATQRLIHVKLQLFLNHYKNRLLVYNCMKEPPTT